MLKPDCPPSRQNGVWNWLTTFVAPPRSSPAIAAAMGSGSGGSNRTLRNGGGGAASTTCAPKYSRSRAVTPTTSPTRRTEVTGASTINAVPSSAAIAFGSDAFPPAMRIVSDWLSSVPALTAVCCNTKSIDRSVNCVL